MIRNLGKKFRAGVAAGMIPIAGDRLAVSREPNPFDGPGGSLPPRFGATMEKRMR